MSTKPIPPEDRSAFGSRLRELRLRLDLTQEEVAALAGLSLGTYNKAENGKGNPCFDSIWHLGSALEVELSDLFKYEHHKAKKRRRRGSIQ